MKLAAALLLLSTPAFADDSRQIAAVKDALRAAKAPLHRCWERAAVADWHVSGTITLSVKIGAKGNDVAVEHNDGTTTLELAACAASAFFPVSFGPAFAVGDTVELPIVYEAEPNVTVRMRDAHPVPLYGGGRAWVLIDGKSASAEQASLTLIETAPGGRQPVAFPGVPVGDNRKLVVFAPPGPEAAFAKGALPAAVPVMDGERISLPAGKVVAPHNHPGQTEILYFVDGTGELTVDGETYPIAPAMAVHIPPGVTHSLKVTTAVDFVLFHVPAKAPQ